jgi:valyl-tRNA synthetase
LWNAARFVQSALAAAGEDVYQPSEVDLQLADRWILSRANRTVNDVTNLLEQFQFGEAGRLIYEFLWSEYCDWYIEISKINIYGNANKDTKRTTLWVLRHVLDNMLRLLHPYMPFVTEEIWQHLPHGGESLMVSPWPTAGSIYPEAEQHVELLIAIVRGIRNARAEFGVEPARRVEAIAVVGGRMSLIEEQQAMIKTLARVEPFRILALLDERPKQALHIIASEVEVYLPLAGMIDIGAEIARVEKEINNVQALIIRTEGTLTKPGFADKAPPNVVDKERARLAEFRERRIKLEERLASLR